MSHTYAARCTVCSVTDDPTCPECGTSSAATHGVTNQRPFSVPVDDDYTHEWHLRCLEADE